MIFVFIAVIAVVSCAYLLAAQYIGGDRLTICYLAVITAICILYFVLERMRRERIIRRVSELFDGGYRLTDESELSGLERRVAHSLETAAARELKVGESYKKIAALVSDISHQCKTPLSSVLMYTEMPPSDQNSAVIHTQAEKLSFLLDALTKLSRCEGGLIAENLCPAENHIETLVRNAVNGVIASAEGKHIEITSAIPDGVKAVFDMRWTTEALFNLLDNAVKYSPPESIVALTVREYEMFARIDIADSGIGISESEQQDIWKRFYRGKNIPDNISGVGIGLYLSQLILNNEGGRISVKSEVGQGSVFSVYLPRNMTVL